MRRLHSPYVLLSVFIILFGLSIIILFRKNLDPLRIYTENFCDPETNHGQVLCDENTVLFTLNEILIGPLAQNDSRIINHIRKHNFVQPPSKDPYNLTNYHEDPSMGQSTIVKNALRSMKNGFFVECGAWDGETRSNTLMLERDYAWTGLLIEADPKNYAKLLNKNRKSWSSFSCLAIKEFPHQVMYMQRENLGKISNNPIVEAGTVLPGHTRVQCFPLFSLLSAINVTKVDYFSLDAEGSELDILKTIPFDSVYFKVISVEYKHVKEGREAVRKYMKSKHFRVLAEVKDESDLANDLIFINDRM